MNKRRVLTIIVGFVALSVLSLAVIRVEGETGRQGHCAKKDMCKEGCRGCLSLEQIHMHMPMILKSIDVAAGAVEAGDDKSALDELARARKMLIAIHQALGKHVKPPFANGSCPIMGGKIKADKVAKNLIREHEGQQVAFCCGGCPEQWDKLSDAEKDAKLAKVLIPAKKQGSSKYPKIGSAKTCKCSKCNKKDKKDTKCRKAHRHKEDKEI